MRAFFSLFCLFFYTVQAWSQQPALMLPVGHTKGINRAAFSPDGTKVVTASYDYTVKIWDVRTGRLLRDLKAHTDGVRSASFSPDGNRILTVSFDNTAKIWEAETGQLITNLNWRSHEIVFACFDPSGSRVATASYDRTAKIWDARTGRMLAELRGHSNWVDKVSFSADGTKVVTASRDSTARVWDVATGNRLAVMKGHGSIVTSVLFSPDGTKVITASPDATAKIWDAFTGELITSLKGHKRPIMAVDISRDGKKLVTASQDDKAMVWDVETGRLIAELTGHRSFVDAAMFSADGNRVLTASSDKTAKVWDVREAKVIVELRGHTDLVNAACFSPDGTKVVTASNDFTSKIWSVQDGKILADLTGRARGALALCFSPDGTKMVSSLSNKTIKVWDVATGKPQQSLHASADLITYSQDGSTMMTTWSDEVSIWNATSDRPRLKFKAHNRWISDCSFSPSGDKIVTASLDSTVKIWDAETGKQLVVLSGHRGWVLTASFNRDGSRVLTRAMDTTFKIWDATTGKLVHDLKGHTNKIYTAKFSPDGNRVVTTSMDGSSKIWDAVTGSLIADLKDQRNWILDAAFSPDGNRIVTGTFKNAKVWDIATGKVVFELKGHTGLVNGVMFSSDGTKILTRSGDMDRAFSSSVSPLDNTVMIWNASTGELMANLNEQAGRLHTAIFSPDGKQVLTASDAAIKLWDSQKGTVFYSLITVDQDDYLVIDNSHRFDGTEAIRRLLYFTCGFEVIELDQLKDRLWVPNLAQRIMRGEEINATTLGELEICGLSPQVIDRSESTDSYRFFIKPGKGGIGQTSLLINGIETKTFSNSQLIKKADGYELAIARSEVDKSFLKGQENLVAIKAYTTDNTVFTRGLKVEEPPTSDKSSTPPNLYAVLVGVSDYKGEDLDLKYAAKDAKDFANALQASARKLLNIDGKEHVFLYDLTTAEKRYQLPEKSSIQNIFTEIGKKAQPNDILLIFFAGHGVMEGEKKQFYFLTADASSTTATTAVKEVGISTEELTEWMKPQHIQAQKRILIFDACNSGQAIKDMVKIGGTDQGYLAARGDEQGQFIKAIDKLNERSGLFILSASASNQSAYEMGRYSQGVLTFSLLKAIKQQPDILEQGKYLDLSRWFHAAEQTVTELTKETGARQQPQIVSNTNFTIGVVDDEVRAKILLPQEKPLFAASILQNANEDIAYDDLGLNKLLNSELLDISSRGSGSGILFSPGIASPDAWSLGGRYEVKGKDITIRFNLRQGNKPPAHKFELAGKVDALETLAKEAAVRAVSLMGAVSK